MPKGAFIPAPSVDSAVLHVADISSNSFASKAEEEQFFAMLHAGFAHKRKLLARNLEEGFTKDSIASGFMASGIKPLARSEDLTLDTWRSLSRALKVAD